METGEFMKDDNEGGLSPLPDKREKRDEIEKLQALGRGIQPGFRIDQVGQLLNVSRSTVYRLLADREIIGFRVRGCMRITYESLLTYRQRKIAEFLEGEDLL